MLDNTKLPTLLTSHERMLNFWLVRLKTNPLGIIEDFVPNLKVYSMLLDNCYLVSHDLINNK